MPKTPSPRIQTMLMDLDRDGFTVIRGALSERVIGEHLAEFEPAIHSLVREYRDKNNVSDDVNDTRAFLSGGRFVRNGMHELHRTSDTVQKIFFEPLLLELAGHRFTAEPVFAHGYTSLYPIHLADSEPYMRLPHSDYLAAAAPDPWTLGLRFWCALEDIDSRSGPFYIRKGSHRLVSEQLQRDMLDSDPELALEMRAQLSATSREDWFPLFSRRHATACRLMHERCNALELETVTFILEKGDVVAFNPATVHGTQLCEDERLTRKNTILNLVADGAPYYHGRSWWGPRHDYRRPENDIGFETERTAYGLRWLDYLERLESTAGRAVVH